MHVYRDINSGQVIESDEPRPDLLEWAYWREVPASERKAAHEPKSEPEAPAAEAVSEPEAEPKPARKPRTPRVKAADAE